MTLHVGPGTFLPVKADDTADHKMHAEHGVVTAETADALKPCAAKGGRIVAVGSTALRTLESAADEDGTHPAVRRRDVDLHHARLSLQRGRRDDDQFPSAALDLVHAGVGLLRARHDEARLCACHRRAAIVSIPMAMPACCSGPNDRRLLLPPDRDRRRRPPRRDSRRRTARCRRRRSCRSARRRP